MTEKAQKTVLPLPPLLALLLWLGPAACVHDPLLVGDPDDDDTPDNADDDDSGVSLPECQPELVQSAAGHPYYLEGDTITLQFGCASGEPRDAFVAQLSGAGGASVSNDWSLDWSTALDDGGRRELVLATLPEAAVEQGLDVLPETAVITLWIADAIDEAGNEPVDPEAYTEEWGLPVIHLEPSGQVGEEHVPATITFMGHSYDAEMKKRGAYSLSYPKNSYTLRFGDEDLDADALGMGNKDHLVLTTLFDDNTYVRQKLCYDLWQAIADYWQLDRLAPRTSFVVVYMDGWYYGLYVASDRIDDHFAEEMGLSRDGNLYKAVNHDANFYLTNANGQPKSTLHDGYEKTEGEPAEGQQDAFADLEALVTWSSGATDAEFVAGADQWLVPDEFMDWFLFVHYTHAEDSAGKNAYLYNDPEAAGAPNFRYCPWDMNHSFGQGWYPYRTGSDDLNDYQWNNGIFAHYQDDPTASAQLWDRLDELMDTGPMRLDWMTATVDGYYETIQLSAERDWQVWGSTYSSHWGGNNYNDFEEEKAYLYEWLDERDYYVSQAH